VDEEEPLTVEADMVEDEAKKAHEKGWSWRSMVRYGVILSVVGGVLLGLGEDPFRALLGAVVAAGGWTCFATGAAMVVAVLTTLDPKNR
jgi:hypothetical protein